MANEASFYEMSDKSFGYRRQTALEMYRELTNLLFAVHFNPEKLKNSDGLCLDVEKGTDIGVLLRFGVQHIAANEPIRRLQPEEQLQTRYMIERFKAEGDKQHIPVIFFEESAKDCVSRLKKSAPHPQFGIIMRLNIHPADLEADSLTAFVNMVEPLLAPGGIMIFSVLEDEEISILQEVQERLKESGTLQPEILTVSDITTEEGRISAGVIGTQVLVLQKPE